MTDRTVARAGLFTNQALAVPLAGVTIEAEISSFCARVAVAQRYVNRESQPIEAVYVFPLDEGAAVCGFEAMIDGTLVVGEVKERDEAFRIYDDALVGGHGAFLLDEERPDVFQASIGNLPPGKEVMVRLTYVTELSIADRTLRFTIPTTVSPRYAPDADRRGVGRPDAEALNPPLQWQVPYGLNLSVQLAMGGGISRVESPSHPVSVEVNSDRATVALSQRDAALDRDFVLSIQVADLDRPRAWIERDTDGAHAVAVSFVPTLSASAAPCEVVFLVDRSGSMTGSSIAEVRNALQLCLRSMISGCTFNIVGFGSTVQALFPDSRAYDEASLREASAHVNGLQADLGGTEILPALERALATPPRSGTVRQIVALTDGQVTNTDAVLALASKHRAHARIFTFGIGAGASQHLGRALARVSGGTPEFIYPGERIEPKVLRQFGRLLSPSLTDIHVDWGRLDVTQAPATVPPIFSGGRLLLYGFLNTNGALERTPVRLTATSRSGPVAFEVRLDPGSVVSGRTVALLAARARIRELEESPEWTAARGSRQRERKASGVTKEIVALSTRYGLMSRETSYVAVERRDTPVLGDLQLRRVPVALTTGWGGTDEARLFASAPLGAVWDGRAMSLPPPQPFTLGHAPRSASPAKAPLSRLRKLLRSSRRHVDHAPTSPPTGSFVLTGLHGLVALQHADGSWDLTPEFAVAIGCKFADLEREVAGAKGPAAEARKAWATALALAWLEDHASDDRIEWRLLAEKGRQWLAGVSARLADGTAWAAAATEALRRLTPVSP